MIILKKNRFLYRAASVITALTLAGSLTVTAGAWSENPGELADSTTAASTSAPETTTTTVDEWENRVWGSEETTTAAETTTTEEEPDAVLDDDIIADEDDEDIEAVETTTAAETAAPETAAPVTTTAAATTTLAPATYTETETFQMLAPQVINVRSGPGTGYDKLGTVAANSLVDVIGISADWYAVSYNGGTGYILSSLLYEVPDDYGQTTTTTTAPAETTLPPVEDNPPAEDEGDGDLVIEGDDEPVYTEEVTTPEETDAPAAPVQTTTEDDEPDAAAPVEKESGNIGFTSVLIALAAAVVTFLLIGVVPILVHRSHHKKLYQY